MCEHAALAAAAAHALSRFPREACGVVVRGAGGLHFVPVANVATDPRAAFAFDASEQLALWLQEAAGAFAIEALVHSHCDADAGFSSADRRAATADDGSPLHPGLEHWVLAIRGPRPRLDEAVAWRWRRGNWTGRPLALPPVAGCVSCVTPQNRI